MEIHTVLLEWNTQHSEAISSPHKMYSSNSKSIDLTQIPIQIPSRNFYRYRLANSKIYMSGQKNWNKELRGINYLIFRLTVKL